VLSTTTAVQATPPTLTVAPARKFVPAMTISSNPSVEPLVGVTLLTDGASVPLGNVPGVVELTELWRVDLSVANLVDSSWSLH